MHLNNLMVNYMNRKYVYSTHSYFFSKWDQRHLPPKIQIIDKLGWHKHNVVEAFVFTSPLQQYLATKYR